MAQFSISFGQSHQNQRDFQTHVEQNRQKWHDFQAHLAKTVQYASFMQNSDFMHFFPKRQKYAKTYAICNCIDLLALLITLESAKPFNTVPNRGIFSHIYL